MKRNRLCAIVLAVVLVVMMGGCGSNGSGVYVQSVASLSSMGGIAPGDRFAGIVVSEYVAQIQKDDEKTVAELLVKEGDDVKEGDALFSYDTDELQLMLDKHRLELEQLKATIENYKAQITELERDRNRVGASEKLQYTIQIQSNQVDLKESELKLKTKEADVAKAENILANATVVSPVTGRVQAINDNEMDNYGNPLPYISIQQSGAYRVKGTLGELQRGGIMEGSQIKILSRTQEDQFWMGTVSRVDYENPTQGSDSEYYISNTDEMTASSKYPFYVELESMDGLILGQHVYLELMAEESESAGIPISLSFVCYEEDGTAYVWAEKRGRLEKRTVVLGDMDDMMGTVDVLEGLTETDYLAFPDEMVCREGAATTHSAPVQEVTEGEVE